MEAPQSTLVPFIPGFGTLGASLSDSFAAILAGTIAAVAIWRVFGNSKVGYCDTTAHFLNQHADITLRRHAHSLVADFNTPRKFSADTTR